MPLTQLKVGSGDIVEQFTRGFTMGVELEDKRQQDQLRELQMKMLQLQLQEKGFASSPQFWDAASRFLDVDQEIDPATIGTIMRAGIPTFNELMRTRDTMLDIRGQNARDAIMLDIARLQLQQEQEQTKQQEYRTEQERLETEAAGVGKPLTVNQRATLRKEIETSLLTRVDPKLWKGGKIGEWSNPQNAALFRDVVELLTEMHAGQGKVGPDALLLNDMLIRSQLGAGGRRSGGRDWLPDWGMGDKKGLVLPLTEDEYNQLRGGQGSAMPEAGQTEGSAAGTGVGAGAAQPRFSFGDPMVSAGIDAEEA